MINVRYVAALVLSVCRSASYKAVVLEMFPNIKVLDGKIYFSVILYLGSIISEGIASFWLNMLILSVLNYRRESCWTRK